jgi:small ligand-binding sensory domain FIST
VLSADPDEAGRRAAGVARVPLEDRPPSFGMLFASAHFHDSAEALLAAVTEQTGPIPLIGCVAEAIVGGGREVESEPAVSLWLAADLGPVETFAMEFVRTASGGAYGGYRFEPDRAVTPTPSPAPRATWSTSLAGARPSRGCGSWPRR